MLRMGYGATCVASLCIVACGARGPDSGNHESAHNHVPDLVSRSQADVPPAADQRLQLQIALPLRNEADLDARLALGEIVSPDEFAQLYHPSDADVDLVRERLEAAGMRVGPRQGALLPVSATVAQAESYFSTSLDGYVAANGARFVAPVRNIQVPGDVPEITVHGLASGLPHQPRAHRRASPAAAAEPTSGPGAFSPNDIRRMYNIPATVTGKGQSVGLMEFDGYAASDVQGYEKFYGLPEVKLTNVLFPGANGNIVSATQASEVAIDIDMAIAMAPGLSNLTVFIMTADGDDIQMVNEIANPTKGEGVVPIISYSWILYESDYSAADSTSLNTLLKQMAAQGQTLYTATGDDSAHYNGVLAVDEYAAHAYAVGVGGTEITLDKAGDYVAEKAWYDVTNGTVEGSGGGISTRWPIPSWQMGHISAASKGSTTMRNAPDVSLAGGPNSAYTIFFQGTLMPYWYGTSCSAPLWAGFHALVNEQRQAQGHPPLGFAAPALYAAATNAKSVFHDVADNSNNGLYPAVAGLDDATGWGSFNGAGLLNALAGVGTTSGTSSTGGSTGTVSGGIGTGTGSTTTGGMMAPTTGAGATMGGGTVTTQSTTRPVGTIAPAPVHGCNGGNADGIAGVLLTVASWLLRRARAQAQARQRASQA